MKSPSPAMVVAVIALFDHPHMDTPGAVSPRAMDLAYQRLTESKIPGVPLAVCPKGA